MTMVTMSWKETIDQWRTLPPQRKQEIGIRRIPRKVARNMAFEGEAVDLELLEKELERLLTRRVG